MRLSAQGGISLGGNVDITKFSPQQLKTLRKVFNRLNHFMVFLWKIGLGKAINIWPAGFGRIMVIKHRGRKSGTEYLTPVNYAIVEKEIYGTAGFGSVSDWYRNILVNPRVELWLPDGKRTFCAEEISNAPNRLFLLRQVIVASGFGTNRIAWCNTRPPVIMPEALMITRAPFASFNFFDSSRDDAVIIECVRNGCFSFRRTLAYSSSCSSVRRAYAAVVAAAIGEADLADVDRLAPDVGALPFVVAARSTDDALGQIPDRFLRSLYAEADRRWIPPGKSCASLTSSWMSNRKRRSGWPAPRPSGKATARSWWC